MGIVGIMGLPGDSGPTGPKGDRGPSGEFVLVDYIFMKQPSYKVAACKLHQNSQTCNTF